MVEVLHEERFEYLALSSMTLLAIGLCRSPLNLSCSSPSTISSSVRKSLKVFIRNVHHCGTVKCDRDLKLDGDLIERTWTSDKCYSPQKSK